jgi:hypothetical protein
MGRVEMQAPLYIMEGKRPSVSCRDDGFFVVSLTVYGAPEPQIYCVWFNEQGNEIARDIVRDIDSVFSRPPVSRVAYCDSGFVIVYEDSSGDGTQRSIYLQYRSRDGDIFVEREKVSYRGMADIYNEDQPAVAVNSNGAGVIVWQDLRYGQNDPDIYCSPFQMLPGFGTINFGSQITVDFTTAKSADPKVTVFSNNDYFMVWSDSVGAASGWDIAGRAWANGTLQPKFTLNSDTLDQRNPDVGARSSNRCYVAWQSEEMFAVPAPDSRGVRHYNDLFCRQYLYTQDGMVPVGAASIPLVEGNSGGKRAWYFDDENYDDPNTTDWNEDPIDEPDSVYCDLEFAIFDQIQELNTNNQYLVTVQDVLPPDKGARALTEHDALFIDLGYRTDDASAGVITPSEQNTILSYISSHQPTMVEGNDFGMMYAGTALYDQYGANYLGDGAYYKSGNIDTLLGDAANSFKDFVLPYNYRSWADNYVDVIEPINSSYELILYNDAAKERWFAGRCVGWGTYWDEKERADNYRVYASFILSSIKSQDHPQTYAEIYRRLLGFLGLNCQPEPIATLTTDISGAGEGCVFLTWLVVSDDDPQQSAEGNYKLKFSNEKMTSETDFDLAPEYYQAWNTQSLPVGEEVNEYLYGLPPLDTFVFALKVSDENNLWNTLGAEPRATIAGDSVTPHSIVVGDNYVKDFMNRFENLNVRNSDSLFVTWDRTNLYVGFARCDFVTEGDFFIYVDTRNDGADSTIDWNGTGSSTKSSFLPGFRPDYVFVVENPAVNPHYYYREWIPSDRSRGSWSGATFTGSFSEDNVVNGYLYTEVRLPFTDMDYDTLAQFRLIVLVQNENTNQITNAFPVANPLGLSVSLTQYYQWGIGLRSNLVPAHSAGVIGVNEEKAHDLQENVARLTIMPNPFRGRTKIMLPASAEECTGNISLKIYDVTGRLVKSFALCSMPYAQCFIWSGTDDNGLALPGGIFFCEYAVAEKKEAIKIIYIK